MTMNKLSLAAALLLAATLQAGAEATLTLGTYNIRYRTLADHTEDPATDKYWDARAENVAKTIRLGDFDVLSLNEMTDDPRHDGRTMFNDLKAAFPTPEWRFVSHLDTYNYTCYGIMYRDSAVELIDRGFYFLGPDPDNFHTDVWDHAHYGRAAIWAKFKVRATGEIFVFLSTHLHHQGDISKNEGSAQNIDAVRRIAGVYPAFIAGDHNSSTTRLPFYNLHSAYFGDSRQVAERTDGSNGTCNVWKGGSLSRLDYIWVRNAHVLDYSTIQEKFDKDFYPSDHFPVRIVVKLDDKLPAVWVHGDAAAAVGGDGSAAAPFKLLQDALDAASNADTIKIARGTYFPTYSDAGRTARPTFKVDKSLTLIGGYNSDFSSTAGRSHLCGDLDGDGAPSADDTYSVITVNKAAALELTNIEISGGNGRTKNGGAVQCNGPRLVLDNCYIHDNRSSNMGAGLYAAGGLRVYNSTFVRNIGTGQGGAIGVDATSSTMPWSHIVKGSHFRGNEGLTGSALYVKSTMWLSIADCCLDENNVTGRGTVAVTGNKTYSTVSVTNSTFANNTMVSRNALSNATKGGSAIFIQDMKDSDSDGDPKARLLMANNTIIANRCLYEAGDVPADFKAAAVNVNNGIDVYLNNNIIAGNHSDGGTIADVYLADPSSIVGASSRYNVFSASNTINFATGEGDLKAANAATARTWLARALDCSVAEAKVTANVAGNDGATPTVRVLSPFFGDSPLNDLSATSLVEKNAMADFTADLQIVDYSQCLTDQRGWLRDTNGSATRGAYEYQGGAPAGAASVSTESDGEPEYYNLSGMRVHANRLTPGIYIERRGSVSRKIIFR